MSDEQPQLPPEGEILAPRPILSRKEILNPSPGTGHVLRLAAIIREVDGSNRLGAAALAEAILSHRDFSGCCPVPATAPTPEPIAWCNSSDLRDAAVKHQSFSGWREQYADTDTPLYAGPWPHPVHASEQPWERKGWLDDQGRSRFYCDIEKAWFLEKFLSIEPDGHEIRTSCFPWHLPHWAIPVPADGELQP